MATLALSFGRGRKLAQFFAEVRQELSKVVWPTRKVVATYSMVVLFAVVVLGAFVFGLDYAFGQLARHLFR